LQQNLTALGKTSKSSTRTRADIAREAGLSGDVTTAALDEKIARLDIAAIQARQARAAQLEKELAVLAQYGLTENSTKRDIRSKDLDPGSQNEVDDALLNIDMLGAAAGLGYGASPSKIAEKIRSDATASEEDIQKTDEAIRLQGLRTELEVLEQQEKQLEAMRLEYEKRKEIQEALIAGDEKRAELLTLQAEAEKLAAQYAAKGLDMATAQQMAADEIARKTALSSKKANAQPVDPLARNVKLRETISSPLADIGGGGVRIRFYENQQLRAVTDTASATLSIRDISSQILTHLQTQQNKAILS
jgi:murein L,D-transpeptidase YcbB/YkuD